MVDHNSQPISVGIVGDGDDVDMLEAFEDVFKVAITNEDAESIRTLEDAHSMICAKLPQDTKEQTKCLTSMAYYRLNRAMQGSGKAELANRIEVPSAMNPRDFQRQLAERSGLRLPFLTSSSTWANVIGCSILGTWVAGPILFTGTYAVAVSILLFATTFAIWRIAERFDKRVWAFDGTLAGLAQQASEVNIGQLVSEGGKWRKNDIWKSMTNIISNETGFPAEKMQPAMTFIE